MGGRPAWSQYGRKLHQAELYKLPGVAETPNWINALAALDQVRLSEEVINKTLGVLLKYRDDIQKVQGKSVRQIVTVHPPALRPPNPGGGER